MGGGLGGAPSTVVITGASSGIGAALARLYAHKGARLALIGRRDELLEAVAVECRELGALDVTFVSIDVCDRSALRTWLEQYDAVSPVDLLIANAGVMTGRSDGEALEDAELGREAIETNLFGVLNTVHPILPRMMVRQAGQIALMSSIAGFVPLADAPSYAASKAAVLRYGLSLRAALMDRGVRICVICPGYVDTPMSARMSGGKPSQISAEDAARRIWRGLARNTAVIAFPFFFAWLTWLGGLLPDRVRRWSARGFRFTVSS